MRNTLLFHPHLSSRMPLKLRPKELLDRVRPSRVADMLLVKLAMPLVKLLRVARNHRGR